MKVPSFLYGEYAIVKKQCQRRVKALLRGASLRELAGDDWLELETVDCEIFLDGPFKSVHGPQLHGFALTRQCFGTGKPELNAAWRDMHEHGLQHPWMLLGMLSPASSLFAQKESGWQRPFLRAMVESWVALDALGPRYRMGGTATTLWRVPTTVQFVLGSLGVPRERLMLPLPAGGLSPLAEPFLATSDAMLH